MNITTHRIKQYNSTYKTVVCVDDKEQFCGKCGAEMREDAIYD